MSKDKKADQIKVYKATGATGKKPRVDESPSKLKVNDAVGASKKKPDKKKGE